MAPVHMIPIHMAMELPTNTGQKDAKGRKIWRGPRGGLYVLAANGGKTKPATGKVAYAVAWAKSLVKRRAPVAPARPVNLGVSRLLADGRFAERRGFLERMAKNLKRKDPMGVWEEARTFQELMFVTTLFVRGKVKETPYHGGPLEDDHAPFAAKDLALVNGRGFVTDNGQSSENAVGKYKKLFVCEQRKAYLTGFLPKDHLDPFTAFVERRQDVYVFVQTVAIAIKILFKTFPMEDNGSYLVTRDKEAATKEALASAPWRNYTWLRRDPNPVERLFQGCPDVQNVLRRECLYVKLAGKEFGQGPSMESVVLEYLDTPEARKLTTAYRFA